jgi:putative ABC transport system permease protein
MMRQIFVVSALNVKSLKSRLWQSMVIVVGLGATVGVLLSMMSMSAGMRQAYVNSGDPGRAIVTSQGAESEGTSFIARADAPVITDAPGIAKDKDGKMLADRALSMGLPVLRKNGTRGYTTMRGFGPKGVALRPEFHLVAGRMFQPGKHEMIVGVGAQSLFQHMKIGDKVILPDGQWPIVGSAETHHLQFHPGAVDLGGCAWHLSQGPDHQSRIAGDGNAPFRLVPEGLQPGDRVFGDDGLYCWHGDGHWRAVWLC